MSDTSSSSDRSADPAADPDFDDARRTAPRIGRRRTTALIVGGVLLFAGGAGTGAVVGTALTPASAATSQTGPGAMGGMGQPPSGQMPGGSTSGQTQDGTQGQTQDGTQGQPQNGTQGQAQNGTSGQAPDGTQGQAPTGSAPTAPTSAAAS